MKRALVQLSIIAALSLPIGIIIEAKGHPPWVTIVVGILVGLLVATWGSWRR